MKIAFATDDHQTISAHFGRAQFYEVFRIEDGKVAARETFAKVHHQPHGEPAQHSHSHDHGDMLAPIADCQVLVAGGMGRGAHNSLSARGIRPVITHIPAIQAAVEAFLAGTLDDHPERLH